jgi:predicted Zn-dependent peptidase
VDKYTLSNGLRVVLEQIPTVRSVSLGIWVKVGSRSEKPHENGISHFIEHMMFKGTEKYNAREIAEIFDGIGGNVNAFTAKEYTCYYCKVLDEHLPLAIDVLSEMVLHAKLDEGELEKEKKVIFEEIAMYEDTPDDMVHDLITQAAYGSHPLAYPILGTEEKLMAMNPDMLRSFMDQHYHAGNIVISAAGNVDESLLPELERRFAGVKSRPSSAELAVPKFAGEAIFYEKQTEQHHICLALPGCSIHDKRQTAMIILNNVIGGSMSSRLFQEIREERGLAYSVYSYHSAHEDSGVFTIYTGTAPEQTEEVLETMMSVLRHIRDHGITDQELSKSKEQMKGNLIISLESTSSRMNRNGKKELMGEKHETLDEMIARIESVTHDQIHEVIQSMFAQPFALAMAGDSEQAIAKFGRDQLVI